MKLFHSALYILLFSLLPIFLIGQNIPFSVNYQAIARDADGLPVANASVDANISILKGGANGSELYLESHSTMTNDFGLYVFVIGEGSTSDDLSQIDWASDDFYLKTVTSIDGGDDLESVAKLNSVPYSFVSYKSVIDNVDDADNDPQNERQDLELNGTQLGITNGNSVDLAGLLSGGNGMEALTTIELDPVTNSLNYIDENGDANIIDLCPVVDNCESVTVLAYDNTTNQLQYIDENGDTNIISMGDLVSTFVDLNDGNIIASHVSGDGTVTDVEETVTTIVDNGNGTYTFTNEDGTNFIFGGGSSTGGGNVLTTLSFDPTTNELIYLDENGNTNTINLGSLAGGNGGTSGNLEDLNNGNVIGIYTSSDGTVTDIEESITSMSFDPVTKQLNYIDESGDVNVISLGSLSGGTGGTALTSLSFDPLTNQLNYTDDNGDINVISLASLSGGTGGNTLTSISFDPATNQLNYLDENGDVNTVDMNNLLSTFTDYNNGHVIGSHTSGDGTVTDIEESVTSLSFDSATKELIHLDEDGTTNVISLSDLSGGTGGNVLTSLSFDPVTNELIYIDENGASNNINLESLSGGTGGNVLTEISFDITTNQLNYLDENGDVNIVDMNTLISDFTDMNDGRVIGRHTAGDGTVTDIEESITYLIDNGDGTLTFTNENGTQVVFTGESTGTGGTQSGVIINDIHSNKIFYVDANGTPGVVLDLCEVTDDCETLTSLAFDPLTNELQYIDEDGNTNIIPLSNQSGGNGALSTMEDFNDGNVIGTHTSGDGTVTNIEETVTGIIDNGDGTFAYVSEDGTQTTFDTQYERDVYMSFVGIHPNNQSQMHYIALEGPEAAAYERGESTLVNGEFFVSFSDHFKQVINSSTMTVQVTPYSADTYGIAVVERNADGFLVKELKGGTSSFSFSWEVKAVRKNLEGFSISN